MIYFNLFLLTTAIASTSALETIKPAPFQQLLAMIPDKMDIMVLPNQPNFRFRDLLVNKSADAAKVQTDASKAIGDVKRRLEKVKDDAKKFGFSQTGRNENATVQSVAWKRINAAEAEAKIRQDLLNGFSQFSEGLKRNTGAVGIDKILQDHIDTVNKGITLCAGKKDLKTCLGGHYDNLIKNVKIVLIGQQMYGAEAASTQPYTMETDLMKILTPAQWSDVRIYKYPVYFNYAAMKSEKKHSSVKDIAKSMMDKLQSIEAKMRSDPNTDAKLLSDVKLRIALLNHIFYDSGMKDEHDEITEQEVAGRMAVFDSYYVLAAGQHLLYDTTLTPVQKEQLKDFLKMYLMKVQMFDSAAEQKQKINLSAFEIDMSGGPNSNVAPSSSAPITVTETVKEAVTSKRVPIANPSAAKVVVVTPPPKRGIFSFLNRH